LFLEIQLLFKGENMRKIALITASTMLIASTVFAGTAGSLDANALAKSIVNIHNTSSEKGSFSIVYGGEDISRTIRETNSHINQPILAG
jgi:hypothetical protein